MDFTYEGLEQAHRSLSGLYDALYRCDDVNYSEIDVLPSEASKLFDDINTPAALTHLHILADQMEREANTAYYKAQLLSLGKLLGLFSHTPHQWRTLGVDKEEVEALIVARQQARANRDYQAADQIRQQLSNMGITLADGIHGTEWRKS